MITLIFIRSCHVRDNVAIAIRPEEKPMYERFAARHGYKVAVRKLKEPTCDNCDHMSIRKTHSGENARYYELMGQYIPDNEHAPGCDYHSAVEKFQRRVSAMGRKGGAA